MKLKWLSWFSCFFLFLILTNALQGVDQDDVFKEPTEQLIYHNKAENENEKRISQTVLSLVPEKSIVFSQKVTFLAYVISTHVPGETPTGKVQISIDGVVVGTAPLVNGVAKLTMSLPYSIHPWKQHYAGAAYLGDNNYKSSEESINLVVQPAKTTLLLVAKGNRPTSTQAVDYIAEVRASAPAIAIPDGVVKFYINALELAAVQLDKAGKATFSSLDMGVGSHAISAIYQGSGNFLGSKADLTQYIEKINTNLELTTSANPSPYGQPITLSAKVSSKSGTPTGLVQFVVDGNHYETATSLDFAGEASTQLQNLSSGGHSIEAFYLGDEKFNSANASLTQQISYIVTEANLVSSQNPSDYGEVVGVTATITSANALPTGYIQFRVDGKAYGAPVLLPRNSRVTININRLKAGTHEIIVDYLGNENFIPSSASLKQEVNKIKTELTISPTAPITVGKPLKIMVKVTANHIVPTGLIQFTLNKKKIGDPQVLSKMGEATLNIEEPITGSYQIEGIYFGNENFTPASAIFTQLVNMEETSLSIDASANPVFLGDSVTITATVSGADEVKGSIQLKMNGKEVGKPVSVGKNHQATFVLSGELTEGTQEIVANYLGNEAYHSSTSAPLLLIVKSIQLPVSENKEVKEVPPSKREEDKKQ